MLLCTSESKCAGGKRILIMSAGIVSSGLVRCSFGSQSHLDTTGVVHLEVAKMVIESDR